ncbi:hypothetical protein ACSS6W_002266 [Trichoderma asperelloides]|uniref:Cell wall mannoprotein 1 n=1 Tax=Trichoderma asperellum TaxID=101201 RepID=A0A6V8QRN5_TRIAP|nr:hypothetical protein LI328DRAFT_163760 [Trichoderma asperelloides]GFP54466.1 hypothetical protein TASIC1_0004009000 [Trichoderma asperellum]
MQFKPLIFLASVLPFTQAQAHLTAKDVVDAIHNILDVSTSALDIVRNISSTNIISSAQDIADDLRQIVTTVDDDVKVLQGTSTPPQFSDDDQSDICEALCDFATTQEDFFNTLVSKKNFLDATTLIGPIGNLLGLLEAGINTLAEGVIALVPTCAAKARDELKDLDKTLGEAVTAFTIPLPNTPTTPPLNATNKSHKSNIQPRYAPLRGVVGSPVGTLVVAPSKGK